MRSFRSAEFLMDNDENSGSSSTLTHSESLINWN